MYVLDYKVITKSELRENELFCYVVVSLTYVEHRNAIKVGTDLEIWHIFSCHSACHDLHVSSDTDNLYFRCYR